MNSLSSKLFFSFLKDILENKIHFNATVLIEYASLLTFFCFSHVRWLRGKKKERRTFNFHPPKFGLKYFCTVLGKIKTQTHPSESLST